jgi:hypothetical protein
MNLESKEKLNLSILQNNIMTQLAIPDYNKPLPHYIKNIACQGTLFALLGSYGIYLWGSPVSYGVLFGYALSAGYNHRYLSDYFKNNK